MAEYTIDKIEYSNNIYNLQDNTTPTMDLVAGANVSIDTDTTNNTITISSSDTNTTYSTALYNKNGLVKPAYSTTGTATLTTTSQAYTNSPTIAARTTTSSKYYGIEVDSAGRLFVNVPWADTKVTTAALTSGTLYYPILATGTGTATRQIDSTLKGLTYKSTAGTTSAVGTALLTVGNSTAKATANNEYGILRLYGEYDTYTDLIAPSGTGLANHTVTLPSSSGILALNTIVTAGSSVFSGGLMSQADKTRLDGLPDVVELTQAEYNALSTSEKNNGTIYYVTDRPVNGLNNLRDGAAAGSLEMTTTSALKSYQVALGTYNLEDTGNDKDLSNFAFIIGNGTSENVRSNLFTVNKSGLVTTHITPTEDYDWNTQYSPVETQYFTGFEIRDAAGNRTTHIDTHAYSDGRVDGVLGVEKIINGEVVRNQIYLRVEADGSKKYLIDDQANFRSAIGLKDAVTEQGTTGIWTYRKWASGVAECWGITAAQSYAITNTYGQGKYVNTSVNYPSGLFIDSPIVHIGKYGSGDGLIWASVNNNTTSTVTFYVADTSSHTVTCRFCIRAIGRWTS